MSPSRSLLVRLLAPARSASRAIDTARNTSITPSEGAAASVAACQRPPKRKYFSSLPASRSSERRCARYALSGASRSCHRTTPVPSRLSSSPSTRLGESSRATPRQTPPRRAAAIGSHRTLCPAATPASNGICLTAKSAWRCERAGSTSTLRRRRSSMRSPASGRCSPVA